MLATLSKILAAVTLIAGATSFGCDTTEDPPQIQPQARAFSGEQLFEGVLLGAGPVAELLPEVAYLDESALTEEERARLEAALADAELTLEDLDEIDEVLEAEGALASSRKQLVESIAAADPTFFARFASAMQSGDHFSVEAALDEADAVLRAASAAADEAAVDGLAAPNGGQGFVVFVWPPINIYLGGALFIAVGYWRGLAGSGSSKLVRERAIGLIVERLTLVEG